TDVVVRIAWIAVRRIVARQEAPTQDRWHKVPRLIEVDQMFADRTIPNNAAQRIDQLIRGNSCANRNNIEVSMRVLITTPLKNIQRIPQFDRAPAVRQHV